MGDYFKRRGIVYEDATQEGDNDVLGENTCARKNKWLGFYNNGEASKGCHDREGVTDILQVKGGLKSGETWQEKVQKAVSMYGKTQRDQ